jgi:hypothetical protein
MTTIHQEKAPVAMCALLSSGMAGDFGECAIVTPDIFEAVRHVLDDDGEGDIAQCWSELPEHILEEFKEAFKKQDYNDTFQAEMAFHLQDFEQLYLFISNSSYSGITLSFAKSFNDIGDFANYVRELNIKIIETAYGQG